MTLSFDERQVKRSTCQGCGREFDFVTALVLRDDSAYAVYHAACHGHPEHEVWMDIILGTWTEDAPNEDHVTFSVRIHGEGAGAVDSPVAVDAKPSLGKTLIRDQALSHARIAEVWEVVDFAVAEDRSIAAQLAQ